MELVLIIAGVFAATGLELKKNYGTLDIGFIPKGHAKFFHSALLFNIETLLFTEFLGLNFQCFTYSRSCC
jgi:hypothetical protein